MTGARRTAIEVMDWGVETLSVVAGFKKLGSQSKLALARDKSKDGTLRTSIPQAMCQNR
jgi:hypothetical protein